MRCGPRARSRGRRGRRRRATTVARLVIAAAAVGDVVVGEPLLGGREVALEERFRDGRQLLQDLRLVHPLSPYRPVGSRSSRACDAWCLPPSVEVHQMPSAAAAPAAPRRWHGSAGVGRGVRTRRVVRSTGRGGSRPRRRGSSSTPARACTAGRCGARRDGRARRSPRSGRPGVAPIVAASPMPFAPSGLSGVGVSVE